jgi:SAM-dependent methyltransferase
VDGSDQLWQEKWSRTWFDSACPDFHNVVSHYAAARSFLLFGCDAEPLSSIWCACLSEAMGPRFREGLRILDYGCGAGRYCNFLSQRLKHFEYFGVEKRGSTFRHGEKSIRVANKIFRHDRRARFGLIDSQLEIEAIASVEVVILGSIFTHVDLREVRHVVNKLRPVIERGGRIVFSAFSANDYRLEGKGAYGLADCYSRVWFQMKQLDRLAHDNGWQLRQRESFLAQDVNLHRIFTLNRFTDEDKVALVQTTGSVLS